MISNLNPKLLYRRLHRSRGAAAVIRRADRKVALRLGHVPHERGARRTAGLHLPAGTRPRRASHRRHHHGAEPRLHGAGLFRCAHARLVEAADRRDGDLVDARRHARAAGAACREPVLPARRAGAAGWRVVGRPSRDGRRPDDRDGRPLCAELQAFGARATDHLAARSRTHLRPGRRRHLSRRARSRADVLGPPDARPCGLPRADCRASTCAVRARIRAAA